MYIRKVSVMEVQHYSTAAENVLENDFQKRVGSLRQQCMKLRLVCKKKEEEEANILCH